MQIAICDDEKIYLNKMQEYIGRWCGEKENTDAVCHTYSSAEQLLFALNDIQFDLYFLDLMLPNMNGLELAKRIREKQDDAVIVFVTANDGFMEVGYEIAIYRYLRKPVLYEKVRPCLEYAYEQSSRKGTKILVNENGGQKVILIKNIVYITAGLHALTIHTSDRCEYKFIYRKKIEDFMDEYCGRSFVRCHRGYLVNLSYVDRFTPTSLSFYNDKTVIPIGRKYHDETIKQLTAFFSYTLE